MTKHLIVVILLVMLTGCASLPFFHHALSGFTPHFGGTVVNNARMPWYAWAIIGFLIVSNMAWLYIGWVIRDLVLKKRPRAD